MSRVGIIIVAYEPNIEVLYRNIRIIIDCGYQAIIVDNSEKTSFIAPKDMITDSLHIVSMQGNQGIAKAQNVGVEVANRLDCNIIGFFDQDSCLSMEMMAILVSGIKDNGYNIVAPVAMDCFARKEYPAQIVSRIGTAKDIFGLNKSDPYVVDIVISSGMFVNTNIFDVVGKFDESLFIDFVDIEWCMRCKKHGERIYVLPNAVMNHKIGEKNKKVGFITISVHSPYRTYYKVRNSLLMLRKGCPKLFAIRQILPAIIHNVILLFGKNGKSYGKFYVKGIKDGILGKGGKYL